MSEKTPSFAPWQKERSPGRRQLLFVYVPTRNQSAYITHASVVKDGKEMIWHLYFSILQIDRSHMLWQLATETDAPIRAVAKHGPKNRDISLQLQFHLHGLPGNKNCDSPHLLTSQEFEKNIHPTAWKQSTWACLIVISWGDESSTLKRVLNLFESCHLGRSFQKMQKSFCNSPILQTTPLPVYIQPLHLKQFQHLLDFIIRIFDTLWIDFDRWAPSWVAYVQVTTVRLFCTWLSSCCSETYAFNKRKYRERSEVSWYWRVSLWATCIQKKLQQMFFWAP